MKIQRFLKSGGAGENMKKLNKKIIVSLVIMTLMMFSLYAKDSFGIGLQFGAIGSKPAYPNLSTTSCDVPYAFNPNVHLDLQFPVCDIDEISFFSINVGYDFSWDYYSIDFENGEEHDDFYKTHLISLIPTFTFTKSNFRFFLGTGVSVRISPNVYEPTLGIGTTYDSEDYCHRGASWVINGGLKYKLGKRLFFIADMSFLINIAESNDIETKDKKTGDLEEINKSGGSTMRMLPKIGLMISF